MVSDCITSSILREQISIEQTYVTLTHVVQMHV